MLKLALRNVLRYRARTALTLTAIVLGVAGLILAGGFVQDVYVQLGEATIRSQLGHLQVYRKGYYAEGSRKPQEYLLARGDEILRKVQTHSEVQEAMLRLNFSGLLNSGRAGLAVVGEGVEADKEERLGTFITMVEGRQLQAGDRFGMLIGEGVAKALRLSVGSQAALVTNTIDGALNTLDLEVIGVFRSFSKDYDNRATRVSLDAARELLAADAANSVVILLKETARTAQVREDIARLLASHDIEIKAWYELSDFYQKTIALYRRQFGFLQVVTLIMVVLSVLNSVSMTAFERAGEFGTMRALGDSDRTVVRLVIMENALLGLAGSLLGVLIGLLLAVGISAIGIPMPPPPNAESGYTAFIRIDATVVATAFAVGVLAAVLAAVLPARRVARLPLVEALRQNV